MQQDGINILRLALHIKKTLQSKAAFNWIVLFRKN